MVFALNTLVTFNNSTVGDGADTRVGVDSNSTKCIDEAGVVDTTYKGVGGGDA